MHEGEKTLGERLETVERLSADIERQLGAGEELLARITRIAGAARATPEQQAAATIPDAKAVAAAAQAFAERTRARISGKAA